MKHARHKLKPKPTPQEETAFAAAERLRAKVLARTGIVPAEMQCPREKSFMTPCIARDGKLAVAFGMGGRATCVGCEFGVFFLLEKEIEKAAIT